MALIFWWMLLIWLAAGAIYAVVRVRLQGRRNAGSTLLPAAHTHRLTSLPEYTAILKKYRLIVRATTVLVSLGLLASVLLTARPANVSLVMPTEQNRDIMLCLDASGSVLREDTTLIDRFSTLVKSFSGQRFGLTLFNSSAVTVIPLNDNYKLISQELQTEAQAFKTQKGNTFTQLTNGTLVGFDSGTSLVGDGLTSCIQHMDPNVKNRSQSILLATDNEVNGTPLVSMIQAAVMARQRNIHVYALDPGVSDSKLASDHPQLKTITAQTGGGYFQLSDPNAISSIIDAIASQAAENFVGLPQLATNDNPKPFLYISALMTVISLAMIWRLEL